MLTYRDRPLPSQPYSEQQRAAAMGALRAGAPYEAYGQNQRDILAAAGDSNAASFNTAISKANSGFEQDRSQARQQLALSGLKQMVDAQNQNAQLQTQRLGMYGSFLNPILGGLFS
jgi:hypothetical protein